MIARDKIAQTDREIFQLVSLVDLVNPIPGDMAEVGVFNGGTASIIYDHMNKTKNLSLFDIELKQEVVDYFGDFNNVFMYELDFEEGDYGEKFSFAHIDTDLYESTIKALEYFYPRMSTGGVILVHDYTHITCAGPQIACVQFFKDKLEKVHKNDSQGYFIKQ